MLDEDVRDKADIKLPADMTGRRFRKKKYAAVGVGIKLKTADFQLH